MYTDEQRQKIAEEEYEDYDVGDKVTVGSGSGKIVVGYVSGVEDTGSGFKAYTVTDIKLPKNPTPWKTGDEIKFDGKTIRF